MPLVKKLSADWMPAENPGLEVGGIIDISDPYWLVKTGKVALVDEQGNEIMSDNPELKAQQLERKLRELEAKQTQQPTPAPVTQPEGASATDYDNMPWNELRTMASQKSLLKPGMNKSQVIEALKNS